MMDDLTRVIAQALGCIEATFMPWASGGGTYIKEAEGFPTCGTHVARQGWPCPEATKIAAALAPLIEARVREARAGMVEVAESFVWHHMGDDSYADGMEHAKEQIVAALKHEAEKVRREGRQNNLN